MSSEGPPSVVGRKLFRQVDHAGSSQAIRRQSDKIAATIEKTITCYSALRVRRERKRPSTRTSACNVGNRLKTDPLIATYRGDVVGLQRRRHGGTITATGNIRTVVRYVGSELSLTSLACSPRGSTRWMPRSSGNRNQVAHCWKGSATLRYVHPTDATPTVVRNAHGPRASPEIPWTVSTLSITYAPRQLPRSARCKAGAGGRSSGRDRRSSRSTARPSRRCGRARTAR